MKKDQKTQKGGRDEAEQVAKTQRVRGALRDVPDYPKPGILFKDLTPLLSDGARFRDCIDLLVAKIEALGLVKIAGIEARGFLFGAAVADRLGLGFIPIRKEGKLPCKTLSRAYELEYGSAVLEVHRDALVPGERVVLIDDVLATGGTAIAAAELLKELGGELLGAYFVLELPFLRGREVLHDALQETPGLEIHALLEC